MMNDYTKEFNRIVLKNPSEAFDEFLSLLRNLFSDYLKGEVSEENVSNLTVFWYVNHSKFSDGLIKIDNRIKDFAAAMDITHPDFSEDKKKSIVNELIKRIDEIKGLK